MSEKRYLVRLTEDERARLTAIVHAQKRIARRNRKRIRAQVLLKVDAGDHGPASTDARAAEVFDVHVNIVGTIRKQLVLHGFDRALDRQQPVAPSRTPVFGPQQEQELLGVAASDPPTGHARWTLRLLAGAVVRLDIVESVCHETVRYVLKKKGSTLAPADRVGHPARSGRRVRRAGRGPTPACRP